MEMSTAAVQCILLGLKEAAYETGQSHENNIFSKVFLNIPILLLVRSLLFKILIGLFLEDNFLIKLLVVSETLAETLLTIAPLSLVKLKWCPPQSTYLYKR